jgi:hypothetical protein
LLFGCGYRQTGTVDFTLPPDAKTIAIPTFRNQSSEPVLESQLTQFVREAFIASNRFGITNDSGDADWVLKGVIKSFSLIPLSFDQTQTVVLEYRVKILLDVSLEDVKSQKAVWRDPSFETTADYFVGSDPSATRVAQDRAVSEAGQHLADDLLIRALETQESELR